MSDDYLNLKLCQVCGETSLEDWGNGIYKCIDCRNMVYSHEDRAKEENQSTKTNDKYYIRKLIELENRMFVVQECLDNVRDKKLENIELQHYIEMKEALVKHMSSMVNSAQYIEDILEGSVYDRRNWIN